MTTTVFGLIGFLAGIGYQEIILLLGFIFIIGIIPLIFYLLTLQNTFYEISPENRRMQPGMVWLMLIPLFGLIWQFIVVNNLADSLKAEFVKRKIRVEEDRPGIGIGMAYCILYCSSMIPMVGFLTSIAGFVCWIIYWVRIHGYKTRLQQVETLDGNLG